MRALVILTAFMFVFSTSWTQLTSVMLRQVPFQKDIQKEFRKYDSLIFVDKANFRYDDMLIKGFGFKGHKVYWIQMTFEKVELVEIYTARLIDTEKHRIKGKITQNLLSQIGIGSVRTIKDKELAEKSAPGTAPIIFADGSTYSILLIDNVQNKIFLKQCDSPINYQKLYATQSRAEFIRIFQSLIIKLNAYPE